MFKVHALRRYLMGGLLSLCTIGGAQAAGLLSPADGSRPPLEIRDHMVNVVIEDGYAITTIEQVFHNPHKTDFEAVYSFPVPEKAAVSEFTYWIDGNPVNGEVLAKKKAREIYEEEKAKGNKAALTEQDSYKTFDITVYPVVAGQDVRIRLGYIQPAHADTGIGRYNYPLEEGGVDEQKLAFWTANDKVVGRFSFDLQIRPAYPVAALRLPSHPQAAITQDADGSWRVHMDNNHHPAEEGDTPTTGVIPPAQAEAPPAQVEHRLDTDILVYWRYAENLPGRVDLVAYRPDPTKPGTFMMTVTPGADLKPISDGRDFVFVLDVSGSMQGKLSSLTEGVVDGIGKMRPEDRVEIVTFNEKATRETSGFVPVDEAGRKRLTDLVRSLQASGSTNLHAGLSQGLDLIDADRPTAIVLVTDGVANVGNTEKKSFLDLVEKKDVRLFTLVMGNSANRPLLESLTSHSGGYAENVSNSDDIAGKVLSVTNKISHAALYDVAVEIDGVNVTDLKPQRIGTLYAGQQLVLFGHYHKSGPADVTIKAKISGEAKMYKTQFSFPENATRNPEVGRLWAFAAIEELMDAMSTYGEDDDRVQAVTDLAVSNGLVTPYTSMLVLQEDVFAARNIERQNKVRLAVEETARVERRKQPIQQTRVDTNRPAFNGNQPTYSSPKSGGGKGSGAINLPALLLILAAFAAVMLRQRKQAHV